MRWADKLGTRHPINEVRHQPGPEKAQLPGNLPEGLSAGKRSIDQVAAPGFPLSVLPVKKLFGRRAGVVGVEFLQAAILQQQEAQIERIEERVAFPQASGFMPKAK